MRRRSIALLAVFVTAAIASVAGASTKDVRLSLVAYSTPREAYAKLIPDFQKTPGGGGVGPSPGWVEHEDPPRRGSAMPPAGANHHRWAAARLDRLRRGHGRHSCAAPGRAGPTTNQARHRARRQGLLGQPDPRPAAPPPDPCRHPGQSQRTPRPRRRLRHRGLPAAQRRQRCSHKLKLFRALATRYDKRNYIYLGTIDVATIKIWLRDPVP